jgi:methionyl aminopeptidase
MFGRKNKIEIKTPAQIETMRRAGLVVAEILSTVTQEAGPGVTTADLDRLAREVIARNNAKSNFLGYYGFPAVICTSVNDEVVHGIPSNRVLKDGDLLSVDAGAIIDGWHGDAAVTIEIGSRFPEQTKLSEVTNGALWEGLSNAIAGNKLGRISNSIQGHIRAAGEYGILEEFVGHGIGTAMHMEPSVPNFGPAGAGPVLLPGMALAIEPMVTLGTRHVHTLDDDWTVSTDDGSFASHWEHTVAITEEGPWVLTAHDGGFEYFTSRGISTPAQRLA